MKLSNKKKASIAAITACLFILGSVFMYNNAKADNTEKQNPRVEIQSDRTKVERVLAHFDKKYYFFKNSTVYKDKRCPKYLATKFVYTYIVEKKGERKLRIKTQYSDQNWLVVKRCVLMSDSTSLILVGEFERGQEGMRAWETLDIVLKDEVIDILEDVLKCGVVKVRYIGLVDSTDYILSEKEKDIIEKTIFLYKHM